MTKLLVGLAGAALVAALSLPAPAQAEDIASGLKTAKIGQVDELSSRHRRWHRRHYVRRYYGGPYYASPYYGGPYWGGYPGYYRPRPYVGVGVGPFGFGVW